jgi:predicted small lipoprotein YifL
MTPKYAFPAAILAGLLACGCGQKGPLFLPGDRSDIQTELPKIDREALEDALDDELEEDEDRSREVPETVETGDDEAEPVIDPASPSPPPGENDQRS